jgi:predicted Zn-dependent protease with MMP-like domain
MAPSTWRTSTAVGVSSRKKSGAPSLVDFEILANEVYRGLPKKFRTLCADLVIRIEDFPTDEILHDMDLDNPFDLLGLFQGVGLPFRAESAPLYMPNMIWLYRRPILDYWSDHEEALGTVVAHVLSTRSGIISAYPTTTWRRSRRMPTERRCLLLNAAKGSLSCRGALDLFDA